MAGTQTFDAACNGKHKLSFAEAKTTALRMRRQREDRIVHYRCDICEWWHVGNKADVAPRQRLSDLSLDELKEASALLGLAMVR